MNLFFFLEIGIFFFKLGNSAPEDTKKNPCNMIKLDRQICTNRADPEQTVPNLAKARVFSFFVLPTLPTLFF